MYIEDNRFRKLFRDSLKDAIICERQVGPSNGGSAAVTITFAQHDGGMEFFNIVERTIAGG